MRRWLALFVLLCTCMIIVVYETSASDRSYFLPEPLGGITIVLDAGHGGLDGGASKGDVIEKEITLAITEKLERQLKRLGAEVIMTRTTDGDVISEHKPDMEFSSNRERKKEDIFTRQAIVAEKKPDMFITVHANAIPDSKWRGAQVFYHKTGHEESQHLAKSIQASIREDLGNTDREALAIERVYLLKKTEVPAVLVETGFISNPEERALLVDKNYQDKMAIAIARGVENYFALSYQ